MGVYGHLFYLDFFSPVKLIAMVEVPDNIEYDCPEVDICYNLKQSLQPVFRNLTADILLARSEIILCNEDRRSGSRDIHIDLTPQGIKKGSGIC